MLLWYVRHKSIYTGDYVPESKKAIGIDWDPFWTAITAPPIGISIDTQVRCWNSVFISSATIDIGSFLENYLAEFDGLGEGDSTDYEAILAKYDSGGGWFIKVGSEWKVAGLTVLKKPFMGQAPQ